MGIAERGAAASRRVVLAIVAGGLVASTVDIGAAALINVVDPRYILRLVAGGLQGKAALAGGAASAWLGLFLQWGMGLLIAAIFVTASLRLRWLTERWILAGLAYGVVVFVVMNYVVVPMSAWNRVAHFTPVSFVWNLLAMLVFGLIVAYSSYRFLGSR